MSIIETTADSLYTELLMLEGVEDRLILLVEGEGDVQFFQPFVDPHRCKLIPAGGRPVALGAAALASDAGKRGVAAFVDADHASVTDEPLLDRSNVIYTDLNDIDAELALLTDVLEKVAETHSNDVENMRNKIGGRRFSDVVVQMLTPITAVAVMSRRSGVFMRSRKFPLHVAYCYHNSIDLNQDIFISTCMSRTEPGALSRRKIVDWIEDFSEIEYKYHNGHLCVAAFHLLLKRWGGYRKNVDNLPPAMRAALRFEEFIAIPSVARLTDWSQRNYGAIWRSDIGGQVESIA